MDVGIEGVVPVARRLDQPAFGIDNPPVLNDGNPDCAGRVAIFRCRLEINGNKGSLIVGPFTCQGLSFQCWPRCLVEVAEVVRRPVLLVDPSVVEASSAECSKVSEEEVASRSSINDVNGTERTADRIGPATNVCPCGHTHATSWPPWSRRGHRTDDLGLSEIVWASCTSAFLPVFARPRKTQSHSARPHVRLIIARSWVRFPPGPPAT